MRKEIDGPCWRWRAYQYGHPKWDGCPMPIGVRFGSFVCLRD
jgi:hypothetical protein